MMRCYRIGFLDKGRASFCPSLGRGEIALPHWKRTSVKLHSIAMRYPLHCDSWCDTNQLRLFNHRIGFSLTAISKNRSKNIKLGGIPKVLPEFIKVEAFAKLNSVIVKVMETSKINTCHQPECGHFRPSSIMDHVSRKNLQMHVEQLKPLEEYYRKQRKLLDFQLVGGPGETWQGLLGALHLQHKDVVGSAQ
ncbi:putative adenylate kinase 7, mitochondrial [Capsicum baccatum]|uniref:Adenylate kinase 7, mitochondrial n=1 Tax=Capsicum baccatum TaxID=33114 RepID=A0A2G2VZE7_CAPBA|nr:putative adenylate kinase 7, mitochondrial [Capsicum baccatum]